MKKIFHNYWQVVAVAFFTTVLALQIPRRALFFSPQQVGEAGPYASFIEIPPEVYGELVDKVRMSWQQRARNIGSGLDSRVGEFDFVDPMPAPEYLSRTAGRESRALPARVESPLTESLLLPPTLALPHETTLPKPVEAPFSAKPDSELIELPDFLKDEVLP